jgi:hypothetical protein
MCPMPFRDQLNRLYFPLLAAHRVSDSKISGANPSSLALKVSWMDVYGEIYDRWLWTAGSWGLAVVLLALQMYQKCLATGMYLFFCQYYRQWHPEVRSSRRVRNATLFLSAGPDLWILFSHWLPSNLCWKKLTYHAHSVKSVKVSVKTIATGKNFQILPAKFLWALCWF